MISFESTIFDLYPPHDFQIDLKGHNLIWEYMVKIPFIYQERLLKDIRVQIGKFNPSIWEVAP